MDQPVSTKVDVVVDYSLREPTYKIVNDPITAIPIPQWLQNWRFENEHEALIILHLFCVMVMQNKVSDSELKFGVKSLFHIANIQSICTN
jgi:hypothetical protein